MSAPSLLLDGALRAAQLVPLLFAFNAVQPAAAQLPRSLPAPAAAEDAAVATVVLDDAGASAPLTLRATHVDIHIAGGHAHVRTTLTYRNESTLPVEALYKVPLPAAFATLRPIDDGDPTGCGDDGGDGDLPAALAQFVEAGEPLPPPTYERGSLRVAPGEEVTVRLDRSTDLIVRGDRHRLVLPLVTQRGGAFAPQFSADVTIDSERPVQALTSATHAAEVSGVGGRRARLTVAGRALEGRFLAFDYALGDADAAVATSDETAWGGEARARHAALDLGDR